MKKKLLFAAFMLAAALLFSQNKVQVKLENPDQQFFELIEKKGIETISHHEGEYIVFLCDYQNFINLRKEGYQVRTLRPDRSTVNHVSLPARDDERRGNDQRSERYQNMAERHRAQKYYEQNRLTAENTNHPQPLITNQSRIADCGTVTDYDENVYNTVLIGDQCWMQSNLQTTHYDNGDPIITRLSNDYWMNTTSGAYAIYPHSQVEGINSDAEMVAAYGNLYNWYAVNDERRLCPEGWRVPSFDDWNQLRNFISGGWQQGGHQLKSCRQKNSPLGGDCDTNEHPRWDEIVCNCNTFYYYFGKSKVTKKSHHKSFVYTFMQGQKYLTI